MEWRRTAVIGEVTGRVHFARGGLINQETLLDSVQPNGHYCGQPISIQGKETISTTLKHTARK